MKKMTCRDLGGACDKEFKAKTFQEMAQLSKTHGTEMFKIKDAAHMEAMNKMMTLMQSPEAMTNWMQSKEQEFNALPNC